MQGSLISWQFPQPPSLPPSSHRLVQCSWPPAWRMSLPPDHWSTGLGWCTRLPQSPAVYSGWNRHSWQSYQNIFRWNKNREQCIQFLCITTYRLVLHTCRHWLAGRKSKCMHLDVRLAVHKTFPTATVFSVNNQLGNPQRSQDLSV